jgi:penicillin-binding protein 1A
MEDVVKVGTGSLTRFTSISMPVAGKTGTTSSDNDLWFVGYTPYYTAGIWSGYDTNKDQDDTRYHKILWRTVMQTIHEKLGKEYKEFTKPSSIVSATICTKSGKLAVSGLCDSYTRSEYFESGTVPTDTCDTHVRYRICSASHKIAGEYCPEDLVSSQVFLLKEETSTTDDTPYVISPNGLSDVCDVHTSPVVEEESPAEGAEGQEGEAVTKPSQSPSAEGNSE